MDSTTERISIPPTKANTHKRVCHVIGCDEAALGKMNGYPTVSLCEAHLKDNERRVRSNVEQTGRRSNKAFFKNNVCEYPGCATKPKYGLIKGGPTRACKHHKKAGMFSSRNGQILYAIHDGDALRSTLPSSKSSAPEGIKTALRTSSDNAKKSHNSNPPQAVRVKPKTPKALEAPTIRKATIVTQNETSVGYAVTRSDHATHKPRSCKPFDVTGTALSAEMKVLQNEREKAVAEARATGRRPRFPSRKVLEASGKLNNDGVQWMTKAMYKAEVQLRKDLRDRRKEEVDGKKKESTARAKRGHSNISLGQPGLKICKRNRLTTTARKGENGRDMGEYSKGTDVPSGFFGNNENTNAVQMKGDGARNTACEPAGRS